MLQCTKIYIFIQNIYIYLKGGYRTLLGSDGPSFALKGYSSIRLEAKTQGMGKYRLFNGGDFLINGSRIAYNTPRDTLEQFQLEIWFIMVVSCIGYNTYVFYMKNHH
ncbi:hypothetical protein KIL84_017279 [Mauremys mutica]|uniref:Uncharacterized protein n=1 Tax=Mauremys mutica TaxID=74926 RepID=A0A9D3X668_9SAUR|nr:hypothetical protein KIL84_017279 [Mauremys mutica]